MNVTFHLTLVCFRYLVKTSVIELVLCQAKILWISGVNLLWWSMDESCKLSGSLTKFIGLKVYSTFVTAPVGKEVMAISRPERRPFPSSRWYSREGTTDKHDRVFSTRQAHSWRQALQTKKSLCHDWIILAP